VSCRRASKLATAPPPRIWQPVEQASPGIYNHFIFHLVNALQGHRGSVTSWWRDRRNNEIHGGEEFSQHLLGLAVDLDAEDPNRLIADLRREGLVVVDEGDHIHVQLFGSGVVAPLIRFLRI